FAFWGIMWLGPAAGLILAAGASFARYVKIRQTERAKLFSVFCDIAATFLSANVYYVVLAEMAELLPPPTPPGLLVPAAIMCAVGTMVLTQYFVRGSLNFVFRCLEEGGTLRRKFTRSFILPVAKYLFCLMAT